MVWPIDSELQFGCQPTNKAAVYVRTGVTQPALAAFGRYGKCPCKRWLDQEVASQAHLRLLFLVSLALHDDSTTEFIK